MLFPIEDHKSWAKKYNLRIKTGKCAKCKKEVVTNIPFTIKGYRGLKSEDHGCGEKYTRKVMVPWDEEEKKYWSDFASKM